MLSLCSNNIMEKNRISVWLRSMYKVLVHDWKIELERDCNRGRCKYQKPASVHEWQRRMEWVVVVVARYFICAT